jgi:putative flippase GtrA
LLLSGKGLDFLNPTVFRRLTKFRFVRFLAVGGCTALVDFSLLGLLRDRSPPTAAFSAAYVAAAATHFLLNKHWTFGCVRADLAKQLAEYLIVLGIIYLVQLVGFRGGLILFNQNVYLAKALAVPPGTVAGYYLLKMRVFKDISDSP